MLLDVAQIWSTSTGVGLETAHVGRSSATFGMISTNSGPAGRAPVRRCNAPAYALVVASGLDAKLLDLHRRSCSNRARVPCGLRMGFYCLGWGMRVRVAGLQVHRLVHAMCSITGRGWKHGRWLGAGEVRVDLWKGLDVSVDDARRWIPTCGRCGRRHCCRRRSPGRPARRAEPPRRGARGSLPQPAPPLYCTACAQRWRAATKTQWRRHEGSPSTPFQSHLPPLHDVIERWEPSVFQEHPIYFKAF